MEIHAQISNIEYVHVIIKDTNMANRVAEFWDQIFAVRLNGSTHNLTWGTADFFIYEVVCRTKLYEFVSYYFQKVKRKYSDQELILICGTNIYELNTQTFHS